MNTETHWSHRTDTPKNRCRGEDGRVEELRVEESRRWQSHARGFRIWPDRALAGHTEDDAVLLRRLCDGDDTALSELHERHVEAVYLVTRRLVDSASDAEEVTQDAFLLLWRKCRRVDLVGTSCLPWLLTTANYLARNVQRAARRRSQRVAAALSDDLASPRDVGAEAARNLELEQVGRIVATLPQIDQDVFRLCVVDGLSYKQAAYQLRTSHSAVRNRLSRVRGALKKQMDQ